MSMSTPPEESTSHVHDHHDSPNAPAGATHTVLSFLEQATSREGRPDSTPASTVLGTAHNMLHRLTSSSSSAQHAHAPTQSPEALLDAAAVSAAPNVLGAAQNAFSRLTHAIPHTTSHKPVPILPPDQPAEASSPIEAQGQDPGSVSSGGVTPPRGVARVTRSYPALPDATHPPRPVRVSHVHRRATGTYPDSETAWHPFDDKDPYREKTVGQRLDPTVTAARTELFKSIQKAKLTGWAQNIAISLQVLFGALTTALGAALSGKHISVAVSILGGASTLVASFIARTKGTNEPQASKFRAQALDHFLREIEAFDLDHGHEIGDKWDEKINGFRLGLERILGNHPGSVTVDGDMGNNNNPNREKWGAGMDPNVGPGGNGNGKYPMTMNTKTGFMSV